MYICIFTNWSSLYMTTLNKKSCVLKKTCNLMTILLILCSNLHVHAGFRGVVVVDRLKDDKLHKWQKNSLNNWIFRKVLLLNLFS